MKKHLLTLLIAAMATLSVAQTKNDGQDLIDTFFDLYKNKGYDIALKYALSTNKWIEPSGGEMDNIIVKLEKQIKTMGEYLGNEQLKTKVLGGRLRYVSYLVYYQRDPIRFTFALYKSSEAWEITDFQYDLDFDKEVEQSMKLSVAN
ncbi:MAG: hypothetical protein WDN75_01215 [Bacteroidota bacterium]